MFHSQLEIHKYTFYASFFRKNNKKNDFRDGNNLARFIQFKVYELSPFDRLMDGVYVWMIDMIITTLTNL